MASNPSPNLVLYATGSLIGPSGPTGATGPGFDAVYESGFTTVVIWAFHIHANGDLQFGGYPFDIVVTNGVFQPEFAFLQPALQALKTGGTVQRVLFSIGTAGDPGAFNHLYTLLQTEAGTKVVTDNFNALMQNVPAIDGFDYDNESLFEPDGPATMATLTQILTANGTNGKIITFCPFSSQNMWAETMHLIGDGVSGPQPVQWWNVQCYSGGTPNLLGLPTWVAAGATGAGIPPAQAESLIVPGLSPTVSTPTEVQNQFASWVAQPGLQNLGGGYMFNNSGMAPWTPGASAPSDYANAIAEGLKGATASPTLP